MASLRTVASLFALICLCALRDVIGDNGTLATAANGTLATAANGTLAIAANGTLATAAVNVTGYNAPLNGTTPHFTVASSTYESATTYLPRSDSVGYKQQTGTVKKGGSAADSSETASVVTPTTVFPTGSSKRTTTVFPKLPWRIFRKMLRSRSGPTSTTTTALKRYWKKSELFTKGQTLPDVPENYSTTDDGAVGPMLEQRSSTNEMGPQVTRRRRLRTMASSSTPTTHRRLTSQVFGNRTTMRRRRKSTISGNVTLRSTKKRRVRTTVDDYYTDDDTNGTRRRRRRTRAPSTLNPDEWEMVTVENGTKWIRKTTKPPTTLDPDEWESILVTDKDGIPQRVWVRKTTPRDPDEWERCDKWNGTSPNDPNGVFIEAWCRRTTTWDPNEWEYYEYTDLSGVTQRRRRRKTKTSPATTVNPILNGRRRRTRWTSVPRYGNDSNGTTEMVDEWFYYDYYDDTTTTTEESKPPPLVGEVGGSPKPVDGTGFGIDDDYFADFVLYPLRRADLLDYRRSTASPGRMASLLAFYVSLVALAVVNAHY